MRTFLHIRKEGFSPTRTAAPGAVGQKGHLLSSGCVIKNIAGLEGQEGSRREQRPGLENNRREKWDTFNMSEGKG